MLTCYLERFTSFSFLATLDLTWHRASGVNFKRKYDISFHTFFHPLSLLGLKVNKARLLPHKTLTQLQRSRPARTLPPDASFGRLKGELLPSLYSLSFLSLQVVPASLHKADPSTELSTKLSQLLSPRYKKRLCRASCLRVS